MMSQLRPGQLALSAGIGLIILALLLNAPLIFDVLASPAVVYDNPVHVLSTPIHAGDTLILQVGRAAWNITGTAPVPADVSRQLVRVDAQNNVVQPREVVVLNSVTLGVDPGHTLVESRLSLIPADLPPGYWRLEGVATARHRSVVYFSEPIEIVAP